MKTYSYRIDPVNGFVFGVRGKPFKKICGNGYVQIQSRSRAPIMAHRMIWEYANGAIPAGLQINHINGIKTDNRIANLEVVTGSENTSHAYKLGLRSAKGESNGRAKLTLENVLSIRERASNGESHQSISIDMRVSRRAITDVVSGRRWGHA